MLWANVHVFVGVEERHGGEVEGSDLAGALHGDGRDAGLVHRGSEGFGRAVELALLDLGALELHEDTLVLDGAHGVAGRRLEQLFVARCEGRGDGAIGDQGQAGI